MLILYDPETRQIKGVSMILNDSTNKVPQPTIDSSLPRLTVYSNTDAYFVPDDEMIANNLADYELTFNRQGKPSGILRKSTRSG